MGLGRPVLSESKEALKAQSRQKFTEAPEGRACALQKCQGYKGQRTEEPFQIKADKRTKCNAQSLTGSRKRVCFCFFFE